MITRQKRIVALCMCVLLLGAVAIAAGSGVISPALTALEKEITLKKCGVAGTDVRFSQEDIDSVLLEKAEFITIDSLPDPSAGYLYVSGAMASEGQLVARSDFEKLVFSPSEDAEGEAVFSFSNASRRQSDTSVVCTVYMLDEINLAPETGDQELVTSKNVAAFKFLKAADPEGDDMSYVVTSYPAHGYVGIENGTSGYFCYVPEEGFTGKDSFEYAALDVYGNKSRQATVEINVSKPNSEVYFDDLKDHWAHNAALRISEKGLLCGKQDEETGKQYFYPDEPVSRGDFLAMALITAGFEDEVSFVTKTAFSDDSSIPANIKSYAEYAREHGIVNGYITDDGLTVFDSTSPITRTEAAVMLDRILSLPEAQSDALAFADADEIPAWAGSAVSSLTECGIMNGTGFGEILPESEVSRAETAQLLCNVEDYKPDAVSGSEPEKKRSISNLFGLLG